MNKKKFEEFLESYKGKRKNQDSLIESIKIGFRACCENTETPEEELTLKDLMDQSSHMGQNPNINPDMKIRFADGDRSMDDYYIIREDNEQDIPETLTILFNSEDKEPKEEPIQESGYRPVYFDPEGGSWD